MRTISPLFFTKKERKKSSPLLMHKLCGICTCVFFLSGVFPIALTVLPAKAYLFFVAYVLYQLCCVCVSLLLSLLAAIHHHSTQFIIHTPRTDGLNCSKFAFTVIFRISSGNAKPRREGNFDTLFKCSNVPEDLPLLVAPSEDFLESFVFV